MVAHPISLVSAVGGAVSFDPSAIDFKGGTPQMVMQFFDYDWYTLMGQVSKGVTSTPGGIDSRFEDHSVGCPTPPQPDDVFSDDPW